MQPLQPEQAAFLLQMALPSLKNEHRVTRKIIEAVPADQGDYRPDEISKTALELAWHIASAENFFMDAVAAGEFNYTGGKKPDSIRTAADVAAWYADAFQTNFDRLTQLSSEQLLKILDFRGMFQYPAVTYLQFALNHSIHHRGQLSVYLRPMGAKVPSIYGESYDDGQARKAASAQAGAA
ncbi:MAG TPA: DinB family protein [Bryobacteraceae bacterium]|nr:DinB family protein [Bryobacteraceae bacterium]